MRTGLLACRRNACPPSAPLTFYRPQPIPCKRKNISNFYNATGCHGGGNRTRSGRFTRERKHRTGRRKQWTDRVTYRSDWDRRPADTCREADRTGRVRYKYRSRHRPHSAPTDILYKGCRFTTPGPPLPRLGLAATPRADARGDCSDGKGPPKFAETIALYSTAPVLSVSGSVSDACPEYLTPSYPAIETFFKLQGSRLFNQSF